jgi:hypothetical protein
MKHRGFTPYTNNAIKVMIALAKIVLAILEIFK